MATDDDFKRGVEMTRKAMEQGEDGKYSYFVGEVFGILGCGTLSPAEKLATLDAARAEWERTVFGV